MQNTDFLESLKHSDYLLDLTVKEKVVFKRVSDTQHYKIENCKFEEVVRITEMNASLEFVNCSFSKRIHILENLTRTRLSFDGCDIESITNKDKIKAISISITNSKEREAKQINEISVISGNLRIDDNYTIENIQIKPGTSGNISNCQINKITLQPSTLTFDNNNIGQVKAHLNSNSSFKITSGSVDRMELTGAPKVFDIKRISIDQLEFNNFSCPPDSNLLAVHILAYWQLLNSNVQKLAISNCNLSKMKLIVENTDLSNTHFDAIKWPNSPFLQDNRAKDGFPEKKRRSKLYRNVIITEHIRIQHIYRQLKHSAENDNDKINYQKFKAYELDRYMRTQKIFSLKEWANNINLWFGRYTNFFGLWWMAPIGYYLLVTYILFVFLSGFQIPLFTQQCDSSLNTDFAKFLNPTHDIIDIQSFNANNWITILGDYFTRIVQGLLGYQTIKGFRKPFF